MIYEGNQAHYKAFPTSGDFGSVATASTGGLAVVEAVIQNRSGDSQIVALGTRMKDGDFKVVHYGDVTTLTVGTDKTAAIQAGTTMTVFPDTAGAGVIIAAKAPFGIVNLTVDSANASEPGYVVTYFNGTSQADLEPNLNEPSTYAVGATNVVFTPPLDWAVGNTAAVDANSLLSNYYCLRIVTSHATDASCTWTGVDVGRVIFALGSVEDDDYLSVSPREDIKLRDGEGISYYIYSNTTESIGTVGYKEIKSP